MHGMQTSLKQQRRQRCWIGQIIVCNSPASLLMDGVDRLTTAGMTDNQCAIGCQAATEGA